MDHSATYSLLDVDDAQGTSVLARAGQSLLTAVEGQSIESQFDWSDGRTLLVLSNDNLYDAMIYLYLLSADNEIEDVVQAGGFFTPGVFETLANTDSSLDFRFFKNGVDYRVSLLAEPRYRFLLPSGWRYKHRLQRHSLVMKEIAHG